MIECVVFGVDGQTVMAGMNRERSWESPSVKGFWWHAGTLSREGEAPLIRQEAGGWVATPGRWGRADRSGEAKYEQLFGGGGSQAFVPATEIIIRAQVRGGVWQDTRLYKIEPVGSSWFLAVVEWGRATPSAEFSFVLAAAGPDLKAVVDYQPLVLMPADWERYSAGALIGSPAGTLSIRPLY